MDVKTARDLFPERQPRAVMPTRAFTHPTISRDPRALQILGIICAHAKSSGITEVGQSRIAELADCSQQAVSYTLKKLKLAGLITVPHKRPTGRPDTYPLNVMRVMYDERIDSNAAQSIASTPTNTNRRIGASHTNALIGAMRSGKKTTPTDTKINGTHSTNMDGLTSTNPSIGMNCELIKHSTTSSEKLESAEAVIQAWRDYAWLHGQEHPIADESDLATAHALVSKGITAEQLEELVIPMPESPRLQPLVRSLL